MSLPVSANCACVFECDDVYDSLFAWPVPNPHCNRIGGWGCPGSVFEVVCVCSVNWTRSTSRWVWRPQPFPVQTTSLTKTQCVLMFLWVCVYEPSCPGRTTANDHLLMTLWLFVYFFIFSSKIPTISETQLLSPKLPPQMACCFQFTVKKNVQRKFKEKFWLNKPLINWLLAPSTKCQNCAERLLVLEQRLVWNT